MISAELPDELTILYRGPLASCNYGCGYCPFAKQAETAADREADAQALARFLQWVRDSARPLRVFFTPWGEALHHRRYREAIVELSRLPHVRQVAAQTNLAGSASWLSEADRDKVALWTTWHPTEVSQDRFLQSCHELDDLGVAYSVGVVARPSIIDEIEQLRARLAAGVPLWLNALSTSGGPVRRGYYSPDDLDRLRRLDPLFEVGFHRFPSRGKECHTGASVISVDGDGTVTRCHFVPRVLGNLYAQPLTEILQPRPCEKQFCDCHIGYVHLAEINSQAVYGPEGLLPRRPLPDAPLAEYLRQAAALAASR